MGLQIICCLGLHLFYGYLQDPLNMDIKLLKQKNIFNILLISSTTIYLSYLRPSGCIFSLVVLTFLLYKSIRELILDTTFKNQGFWKIVFLISSLIIVIYNFNSSLKYSIIVFKEFSTEGGFFFGYSRDLLRSKLTLII